MNSGWRCAMASAVVVAAGGCPLGPAPDSTVSAFGRLQIEVTQTYFSLVPEMATYYGVPEAISGRGLGGRVSEFGPLREVAKREAVRGLIAQLEATGIEGLTDREAVVRAVFLTQLRSAMAPAEVVKYGSVFGDWGMWFVPYAVTQLYGPQNGLPKLLENQHTVTSVADAKDYLARLEAYGVAVDQAIGKMEHERALGVIPPDFVIDKAIDGLVEKSKGEAWEHSLVASLDAKLRQARLDPGIARQAEKLVREVVFPANARLKAALESLREAAQSEAGIWRLPEGEALYRALIRHMTDTNSSPQEIHDLGLAEVARITAEMDALLTAEGYTEGSVGQRMSALGEEERFLYANTEEGKERLIADLNAQLAEIAPLLADWFGTLPEHDVVVRAIPSQAEESSAGGYYDPPALDGSRPGTYWINLRDTAIWPSFSLKTLTYHEANPGHHLQTAVGMGLDTPILQSVLFSNGFGEGWALYSEALAAEMGLYEGDPYGDLGRLQDELWRAIRLVVDTGLHALRWGRQQSIDYMVEASGTHPSEAESEVDRYCVWPGQALGYKIGMLKIQELRAAAEEELGERFDIRGFHDEVLSDGAVPLQVLEQKVKRWVGEVQASVSL